MKQEMFTVSVGQMMEILKSRKIPTNDIQIIIKRMQFYNALNSGEGEPNTLPFDAMNLSTTVRNILAREHIFTEEQLKIFVKTKGVKALKNLRNLGSGRYAEMVEVFPWQNSNLLLRY